MINKITNNLEAFNYNVIIANIYEIYNFINKIIDKEKVMLIMDNASWIKKGE